MNIAKILERKKKLEQQRANILSGKSANYGIKTKISDAQRLARQAEKARRDFIAETMSRRSEILQGVVDFSRVQDKAGVCDRALSQAQDYCKGGGNIRIAILEFSLHVEKIKEKMAEKDVENIYDAREQLKDFENCLAEYLMKCLECTLPVIDDEVKLLWENCVTEKSQEVLLRGTTVFDSIDFHANKIFPLIKSGEMSAKEGKATLKIALTELFKKYGLR